MKVEWCHVTSGVKDVVPQVLDNGCYEGFEDLVDRVTETSWTAVSRSWSD